MTKIEQIKAEIERLKGQLIRGACAAGIAMETSCKEEAYNEILAFIDSLQDEPDEDLEKAASSCHYHEHAYARESFIEGANWHKAQTRDEHFWNGMQHAKEELMKEAVEADIMLTNEEFGKQTYVELCFRPKRRIYSNKVRIIILKEED